MKRLLLFQALFLSVLAAPYSDSTLAEWDEYKDAYDKLYETPEEDTRRLETYLASKRMVDEHNSRYQRGETTFTMTINKFADWFPEELDQMTGRIPDISRTGGRIYERQPDAVIPDSVNWVEKGAVTPVKEQGREDSGFAFSAAGALEGLMFTTNKTITDLSVQELADCFTPNGFTVMSDCFVWVTEHGLESERSYPYEGKYGQCRADDKKAVMSCTGLEDIDRGDEKGLQKAVALHGPVSIAMKISHEFVLYHSGVFDGGCFLYFHGMLAVGYDKDEETGKDYWLVKNSWGTNWGEKGYVRVARNENKCNISDYCSYPTYSPTYESGEVFLKELNVDFNNF